MTRAGVVAARGADRWWAWAATRVAPASTTGTGTGRTAPPADVPTTTAAVHNEYTGAAHAVIQARDVHGGVHVYGGGQPVPDDSAWLRSCWESLAGATMEIRYLTRPGSGLDAFLVLRAEGAHQDEAEHRVTAVRDRLGALPGHVTATPVTDPARTHEVLEPFQPHHEGIVEVRKRLTTQRTSRDDTYHPWLTAVTPLTHQQRPWDPLWAELARLPCHAMVSVGLAPFPVGAGLRAHLAARAVDLDRLARPGPSPTAVWRAPRPPDEFAAAAHALASDAVRRYTDRAFLLRVSVATDRPVPGGLAELVADTISASIGNHGFAGAAPAVVRPAPPDLPTAWHNVTALNFAPLSAYDQGSPAGAVDELARVLSAIVDLDEATAAFRLPYRSPGRPGFFDASPE